MNDKYNEYKGLNLPNVAKEILEKWQNESIFEKSIALREGNPSFVFLKDRHQQMVCRVFIMQCPALLKIYFVAIKH